jgi:hypothetical protein
MALLSSRGISTPSLQAQGEQRRSSYFNNHWDIAETNGDKEQALANDEGLREQYEAEITAAAVESILADGVMKGKIILLDNGHAPILSQQSCLTLLETLNAMRRAFEEAGVEPIPQVWF